jgi:hypothetical protein
VFSLWFAAEAKPFSMDRKRGRRELQRPSPLANRDRGTGRSGTGMGAYAVLVMAGAARPHCSYTARIAAASASETTNMPAGW